MANTIKIKRSSTASGVPTSLDYGELAINYADGKLFYKNVSNTIVASKLITSVSGTANQISVSETSGSLTISLPSAVTISGDISAANLVSTNSTGDEGGEIRLAKPATNSTISTSVTLDVYQNKLRIFETGGTTRGYYIDITSGGAGASTNLVGGGSGTVTSITAGTGLSGRNNNNFWNYSHRLYCCNFNWVSNFNKQNPYLTSN